MFWTNAISKFDPAIGKVVVLFNHMTTAHNAPGTRQGTVCRVFKEKDWEAMRAGGEGARWILRSETKLHPRDQFSKARGRKVALAKAFKFLPREYRRQLWEDYFAALKKVKA